MFLKRNIVLKTKRRFVLIDSISFDGKTKKNDRVGRRERRAAFDSFVGWRACNSVSAVSLRRGRPACRRVARACVPSAVGD